MCFNALLIDEQTLINEQDAAKLYEVVHKVGRIRPDVPEKKESSTGDRTEIAASYDVGLGTFTPEDG